MLPSGSADSLVRLGHLAFGVTQLKTPNSKPDSILNDSEIRGFKERRPRRSALRWQCRCARLKGTAKICDLRPCILKVLVARASSIASSAASRRSRQAGRGRPFDSRPRRLCCRLQAPDAPLLQSSCKTCIAFSGTVCIVSVNQLMQNDVVRLCVRRMAEDRYPSGSSYWFLPRLCVGTLIYPVPE